MSRPTTTLFMLMSLDGKISTGSIDERDMDKDLPNIPGVSDGLQQYYALEEETDLCSLNTGRNMAKVGWNEEKASIDKLPVSFVIIDSKPHLTELGIGNLLARTTKLFIVTTNTDHPATHIDSPTLQLITYDGKIDFDDLFTKLQHEGIDKVTVQSGSQLNATLARAGLIDFVSLVVAPVLIGGKDTASLIGGSSLDSEDELKLLKPLELVSADVLNNSYLLLRYKVKHTLAKVQ